MRTLLSCIYSVNIYWAPTIYQALVTGDIMMCKTRSLVKFDKHTLDQINSNCDTYA